MIAITEDTDTQIIAVGTHAELIKKIRKKRAKKQWQFPIRLISDHAHLTNDENYLAVIGAKPWQVGTKRQARFVLDELSGGTSDLQKVADVLGLTKTRVMFLVHRYKLRRIVWKANSSEEVVTADTAEELAMQIGLPVGVVRSSSLAHKARNGWKVVQGYELKEKV